MSATARLDRQHVKGHSWSALQKSGEEKREIRFFWLNSKVQSKNIDFLWIISRSGVQLGDLLTWRPWLNSGKCRLYEEVLFCFSLFLNKMSDPGIFSSNTLNYSNQERKALMVLWSKGVDEIFFLQYNSTLRNLNLIISICYFTKRNADTMKFSVSGFSLGN